MSCTSPRAAPRVPGASTRSVGSAIGPRTWTAREPASANTAPAAGRRPPEALKEKKKERKTLHSKHSTFFSSLLFMLFPSVQTSENGHEEAEHDLGMLFD